MRGLIFGLLLFLVACVSVRQIPDYEDQLDSAQRAYLAGCIEALSGTATDLTALRTFCEINSIEYRDKLQKENPQ